MVEQVTFQCLPSSEGGQLSLPIGGMTAVPSALSQPLAFAKLELFVGLFGDHYKIDYMAEYFEEATICRLRSSYLAALEAIAASPSASPWDLDIFSPEAKLEVATVSAGPVLQAYLREPLFHEGFAARAAECSAAPCLTFCGVTLTYGEVDARADALARRLVALGVGVGSAVGLMLDRSFELVIAMLAILKAGGA